MRVASTLTLCVLLAAGCTSVEHRRRQSLAQLRWRAATREEERVRRALLAAVESSDAHSLASPRLVEACFRPLHSDPTGGLVLDWVAEQPMADGAILFLKDGRRLCLRFGRPSLNYNRRNAHQTVIFQGVAREAENPGLWTAFDPRDVAAVMLGRGVTPVSNKVGLRILVSSADLVRRARAAEAPPDTATRDPENPLDIRIGGDHAPAEEEAAARPPPPEQPRVAPPREEPPAVERVPEKSDALDIDVWGP